MMQLKTGTYSWRSLFSELSCWCNEAMEARCLGVGGCISTGGLSWVERPSLFGESLTLVGSRR